MNPWLPAKLPTVSSKMLHNSVCLLHFLHTVVLSVVLHIELPYSIAYCIAYSTVFMWLVFGLCGMRRVGGEGRGSYSTLLVLQGRIGVGRVCVGKVGGWGQGSWAME